MLNAITVADVRSFIEKQKRSYQQTKPYKGFNSYVAPSALHELQIDIGDWTHSAEDNNGFRYMFLATDVFTKSIHCVPIKDKQPQESMDMNKTYIHQ